jgi:peroxiredoxin Q/BCP
MCICSREKRKAMKLKVDEQAPLFEASADNGEKFSLADLIGKSNIVLYFYPKDFTLGCTKEACAFRDNWNRVLASGATVVGISSDSPTKHADFKRQYKLPFTLVSDQDKSIRKMYGATGSLIPPRITFVIDKSGKIKNIFNSQLDLTKHVEVALETLNRLSNEVGSEWQKAEAH